MTPTARIGMLSVLMVLGLAAAPAAADVCVSVDESRDTLTSSERAAALVLLTRQFELAGERVVADPCPSPYTVSHVRFGETIIVTLSGPTGHRDATALGLDDVPALYSQMVRSLLTGRPMDAHGVLDRTNVTAAQAQPPNRVESDSVVYARLGYGAVFADTQYGGPSVGLIGYRKEFNRFAIDVSFFNFQYRASNSSYSYEPYGYGSGTSGFTGSWLKLETLRFATPLSDRSLYFGGGLSLTSTNLERGGTTWHGNGLQGELTAGYELGRASTIRIFVQADAGLPFYEIRGDSYTYSYSPRAAYTRTTTERYAPSLAISIGLGWQRGRH